MKHARAVVAVCVLLFSHPARTLGSFHFLDSLGKEEAAIRRKKLEAIGGGGSQFVLPKRDWRGIS